MILPYTQAQADAAHEQWGAMCGHYSIAAATGKNLDAIRDCGVPLKGWMNPTMIRSTLDALAVTHTPHRLGPGHIVDTIESLHGHLHIFDDGGGLILRIQWEGSWLNPGVPAGAAYQRTHYIAFKDGWIMDPAYDPCNTLQVCDWLPIITHQIVPQIKNATGWHFTHAWTLHPTAP